MKYLFLEKLLTNHVIYIYISLERRKNALHESMMQIDIVKKFPLSILYHVIPQSIYHESATFIF